MANETGPYEGGSGAGGKIRRQPAPASASARKGATPYDRPLSGRHAPAALRKASWFAKIVDPASRIIANSAVRFFSSVFKKRLPAPSSSEDDNTGSDFECDMKEMLNGGRCSAWHTTSTPGGGYRRYI